MLNYTPSTVAHILNELRKTIVGQDEVIEQILVAVLAEGHALLEGVPGTAKTQAALLEAMEERQMTIDGERYPLSPIFTVLATENPIEYEGTYPLPEAQLDRFQLKIILTYPNEEHEREVVSRWNDGFNSKRLDQVDIRPLQDPAAILHCRAEVARARMEPGVC